MSTARALITKFWSAFTSLGRRLVIGSETPPPPAIDITALVTSADQQFAAPADWPAEPPVIALVHAALGFETATPVHPPADEAVQLAPAVADRSNNP